MTIPAAIHSGLEGTATWSRAEPLRLAAVAPGLVGGATPCAQSAHGTNRAACISTPRTGRVALKARQNSQSVVIRGVPCRPRQGQDGGLRYGNLETPAWPTGDRGGAIAPCNG